MTIRFRPYDSADWGSLSSMLLMEGIKEENMGFNEPDYKTIVMVNGTVKGFFTVGRQYGVPYLLHFCVNKEHRNPSVFRKMVSEAKKVVKSMGDNRIIIGVPLENQELRNFVSKYCRTEPYACFKSNIYYLYGVK